MDSYLVLFWIRLTILLLCHYFNTWLLLIVIFVQKRIIKLFVKKIVGSEDVLLKIICVEFIMYLPARIDL